MLNTIAVALVTSLLLPVGSAPKPVETPHFPDRQSAFIWRNWQLVPAERLAETIGATPRQVVQLGRAMGLSGPPEISSMQRSRSALTVIRRNWHLLPYDQLLKLLGWSESELAFALREDDFLYIKLGSLKPQCEPILYHTPSATALQRAKDIGAVVRHEFPDGPAPCASRCSIS